MEEKISDVICDYIIQNWMSEVSNRAFAIEHDIDEKTVRKIKNVHKVHYTISIETLEKICKARGWSLQKFFTTIQR